MILEILRSPDAHCELVSSINSIYKRIKEDGKSLILFYFIAKG